MSRPLERWQDLVAVSFSALLVGVPLVYANGTFDYTLLPKQAVLFSCIAVAALAWCLGLFSQTGARLSASPLFLPLVCFASWMVLTFARATHTLDALYETLYQTSLIGLTFLAANALPAERVRTVLSVGVIASLPVSALGILQYHDLAPVLVPSNGHPSATFGFRNFAAMYLICIIPLASLLWLTSRTRLRQGLYALAAVLAAIFLVYTRTRGAWVGIVGGSAIAVMAVGSHKSTRDRVRASLAAAFGLRESRAIAVGGLLLFGLLALLPAGFSDTGLQRFDEKKDDVASTVASILEGSGRGRQPMWTNTARLIGDHPVLGTGPGGWKRVYPSYDGGDMVRRDSAPRRPHNDFLWIAADYGTVGLALFFWFLASGLRCIWRMGRSDHDFWALASPAFGIAVLSVLVHGCFSFPREQPQSALFIYLLFGIAAGRTSGRVKAGPVGKAVVVGLIICSTAACHLAWRWMTFDRHYLNALLLEDDQDWPQVRDQLEAGLSVGVFRPHAQFVLGRALEKLGRYGDARRTYEQALEREPNAWYTYNGLGIAAKKQGDYDAAQAAYGRALRLYPQSDQVQINLGALFKEQGDRAKQQGHPPLADSFYHRAEAAYRLADPPSSGVQNNLGNLFKATARFDSAETAYLRAIELDSTMVEAHFNLGDLYMKQGRRDQAVVHLRTAAGITPDNARVAWALGLALEAAGRSGDALEAFSRTLLLDPGFAKALYKLGNIRFEQGDYERAASAFTRFLDIWEGDAVYREFAEGRRAEAAMEMGRQGR